MFCLHVCPCEGVRSPGTGVKDRYELRHGCWELNPSLVEQPVFLTIEPSFQPLRHCFLLFLAVGGVRKALKKGHFWRREVWKIHLRLCYLDRTGSPLTRWGPSGTHSCKAVSEAWSRELNGGTSAQHLVMCASIRCVGWLVLQGRNGSYFTTQTTE